MICIALVVRRTAIPAVLAALALAASAACSDGGGERGSAGANPTVATDPPTTTTTNPYAVPAVIDAAYVNRVMAALDQATGEVVRLAFRTKTIPPEALDRLRAVYASPDALQLYLDGLQIDLRGGFKDYRSDIGNRSSIVTQLVSARSDCVFAQVRRDYSAVGTNTSGVVNPQWVALKRLDQQSSSQYNPTPWGITYDGFTRDRSRPRDPCAS
jgi:hypothetical protein